MESRTSLMFDFKKLKKIFEKNPVIITISLLALFAVVYFFVFNDNPDSSNKTINSNINIQDYTSTTESKVKNILEKIEGVGNCDVMLSVETGVEYVYATEQSTNNNILSDSDNTYKKSETQTDEEKRLIVINDGSGGERALVAKEIQPKIQGVAVVCDGAKSTFVKSRVIDTVTTVLNISSDKVCVIEKQ